MTRAGLWSRDLMVWPAAALLAVLAGCSGGSNNSSISGGSSSSAVANTADVTVGFGVLGPSGAYVNGIWASVTLCVPGTNNCQTIPNLLVDTGSVGIRILDSALTLSLPSVKDSSGNVVQECVSFADFSYVWGPVARAGVEMPNTQEQASQVPGQAANSGIPIQLIAANPAFSAPSSCLSTPPPSGGSQVDENTIELLGANGILGVGMFQQDCGTSCSTSPASQYYVCPGGTCTESAVPLGNQLWNPVSAFSSKDNNGIMLRLPSVGASGAASVSGSLIFGLGTQSDNALGSAKIFEVDQYGNFPQVVLNGVTYSSPNNGSFIDTGSNAYYVSDASSLSSTGIVECGSGLSGYYCPGSPVSFNVTVSGANGVNGTVPISIANASVLLNSGFAAFNNVGGDSGTGLSNDYVDLGLPFFFGRSVFIGIAGTSPTYPNGYWAF